MDMDILLSTYSFNPTTIYILLQGGLPPEMAKALASDPEIMQMLKDKKMQEIMSAVMEGLQWYHKHTYLNTS